MFHKEALSACPRALREVEGGQATLFVTPSGESMLIDTAMHKITLADLPGYVVSEYVGGLDNPRLIRTAPNGPGYKVIRVPFKADGTAVGPDEDFLTGSVTDDGYPWGRPVGVAVDRDGSLLVSDDGSNTIWRVAKTVGTSCLRHLTGAAAFGSTS